MSRFIASMILATTLCAAPALAAPGGAGSVAYVETQRIFREYDEAQKAQSNFRNKAEAYQRELAEDQQKLEEAKKAGKSAKDLREMQKQFEENLKPKKLEVESLDRQLSSRIKKQIMDAIEQVAKSKGYTLVLDKATVLFGGVDISDEVIKRLNR
jgi:outer membrane protein